MQPHRSFCIVLFVLVVSVTAFAAPSETENKAAEVTWSALRASLDSKQPFDTSVYNGAHVSFSGYLDHTHGGVSRVLIYRYNKATQQYDAGPVCHVTLRKSEIKSMVEQEGTATVVRVFGKITHLDATTKTVEVQSEGTYVEIAR